MKTKYKYFFKRAGQLTQTNSCCIDPDYDDGKILAAVNALNNGTISPDEFWFETIESYPFVPKNQPAILRKKISRK